MRRGVERLGWSGDFIHRNAHGCVGSGVCAFGCPSGAKQHVGISYVPRAWEAGATTYTGARAQRVEVERGRARAVIAQTTGGGTLHVACDLVIVACGAIHTPLFLRRQGIGRSSGQLGRNLAIHPAAGVRAILDEEIEMWRGVPQSYYVDEFATEGIMLEGTAGPPDFVAMAMSGARSPSTASGWNAARNVSAFGVMVSDSSRGSVDAPLGVPRIRYDLNREDTARFKRGIERLTEAYWAAGATEVLAPIRGLPPLRDGDSGPLRDVEVRARDLELMAFHPLGTARMGADPAHSVLDPNGRLHDVEGLYVADASAVPTAPRRQPADHDHDSRHPPRLPPPRRLAAGGGPGARAGLDTAAREGEGTGLTRLGRVDVDDAIRARRTIKAYAPLPVHRETLEELFELARWAPNHHLTNPWRFRVLGPETLDRLKEAAGPEAAAKLDRAPTLVVASAVLTGDPDAGRGGPARRRGGDLHPAAGRARARPGRLLAHAGGAADAPRGAPRSAWPTDEQVVGLVHLGKPRQGKEPPDRAPAEST